MISTHTHEAPRKETVGGQKRKTAFDLLETIRRMYPNADAERLCAEWRIACEETGDEAIIADVWQAVFVFLGRNKGGRKPRTQEQIEQMRAQKAVADLEMKTLAQQGIRQWLTLGFTMPNGKALGECTGTEVGQFGRLFEEIARKVGDRLVKEVYRSDEDLPKPE
jgi:hypothetical protein